MKHCGNGVPVFVTDYPAEIKPFYARRNDDGRTVAYIIYIYLCFLLYAATVGIIY